MKPAEGAKRLVQRGWIAVLATGAGHSYNPLMERALVVLGFTPEGGSVRIRLPGALPDRIDAVLGPAHLLDRRGVGEVHVLEADRAGAFRQAAGDVLFCPKCGYNMTGLYEARCPECGSRYTLDQLAAAQKQEQLEASS